MDIKEKIELYKIVLEELKKRTGISNGLCLFVDFLEQNEIIEHEHSLQIVKDLNKYRDKYKIDCAYIWQKGQIKPRIDFLTEKLKEYEA